MSNQQRMAELSAMLSASYGRAIGEQEANLIKIAVKRWGFDAAMAGFEAHLFDTDQGRFFPTLASIAKQIEGPALTPVAIVAAARAADTPLGCLARIKHLPKPDLDSRDSFYLHAQAEQFLQQLPAIRERISTTGYKKHELNVLAKYGVDAAAPFALGLGRPANALLLQQQAEEAAGSKHQLEFLKPAYDESVERLPPASQVLPKLLEEVDKRMSQQKAPALTEDEKRKALADCEARKQARQDSIIDQVKGGGDEQ